MPVKFKDLNKKSADLMKDHHEAGAFKFEKKGTVNGDNKYTLKANCADSGAPVAWDLKIDSGKFNVKIDHNNKVSKEIKFSCDKLKGFSFTSKPNMSGASVAENLGALDINYANDKVNFNSTLNFNKWDSMNFDVTANPITKCQALILGLKGNVSTSGFSNGQYALALHKGNLQTSFISDNLEKPFTGKFGIYANLPENKNFYCYALEGHTSGKMALGFADGCCSNTNRFKIDQSGKFSYGNVRKINSAFKLNLSAEFDLTNLSGSGHKFGAGVHF